MSIVYLLVICIAAATVEGKILRPRGVSPSDASFYQPAEHFTCISTSEKIPYSYINDNYCDCEDGSDEPGTSACANRSFYCVNKGFFPSYVPSSRVDDGICDCCDGSDEDGERIQCPNTCDELGKKEREERELRRQLQEEGFKKKQEMVQEAIKEKEEKKTRLEELQKERDEMTKERDELEVKKTEAEAPEKEAKEKHEKAWEEVKAQKQQQQERAAAEKAFEELDTNQDQHIDTSEIEVHGEFDIDSDGTVSADEAKEHLEDLERVGLEDFTDKVWPHIKEIYKSPSFKEEVRNAEREAHLPAAETEEKEEGEEPPAPPEEEKSSKPPVDDIDHQWDEDDDDEDDDEDWNDDDDGKEQDDYFSHLETMRKMERKKKDKEEEEKMPDYDEETKKLIEAADAARQAFREVEDKVRNVENEINDLNKYLQLDLGPEEEYGVLKGKCFEYTDREYTYKFCPFEKTSQRPKAGGTETSLGTWGKWDGTPEDRFAAQKYERGQNCWNGPDRSAKVLFHCGIVDELTSASEPNRCEYQFDFSTPAKCAKPSPDDFKMDTHDEL